MMATTAVFGLKHLSGEPVHLPVNDAFFICCGITYPKQDKRRT
jgi:hypothetical protein